MDQIQSIRIFVRVVEAGNFTRAAESLDLPKGTVTKQIQALEARLRVLLLNRTTRRVSVTPDGAAYYERAVRLLNDFDELESSMGDAQASPQGRLRVEIGTAAASLLIMPALRSFCDRYPDIQVDISASDRTADLIGDNIDCAIRMGELTDPSLVARRIGNLSWASFAAPAYLQRHGTPAHPRELENKHLLIGFFAGGARRLSSQRFEQGTDSFEFDGPHRVLVNDSHVHMAAVVSGFGLSQAPRAFARPQLERGELVEVLQDWQPAPLPVYVVYAPNRHLSAKVRVFVDWAVDLFGNDPQLRRR